MSHCLGRWTGIGHTLALCLLVGCQSVVLPAPGNLSFASSAAVEMTTYPLSGDTRPVLDPGILRQGSTYYVFSTDVAASATGGVLTIRCSQDEANWTPCGSVFHHIPEWVRTKVPDVVGLWAPDISYFGGQYHLYYAGSSAGSQRSVIGLATNATLDPGDPAYKWIDRGEVIESSPGDDFNAIDPNILVDVDGSVRITYGSYWSGIKQMQIDPQTGKLLANSSRVNLATRPGVPNNPIEGASLVRHGNYYYLFVSVDYCCNADNVTDNYKEAVGRSTSPQGPFVDTSGTPMMKGGGTVILEAQGKWNAPGGGTAYVDAASGESTIVFHALNMTEGGEQYLWVKQLAWQNDWPVPESLDQSRR